MQRVDASALHHFCRSADPELWAESYRIDTHHVIQTTPDINHWRAERRLTVLQLLCAHADMSRQALLRRDTSPGLQSVRPLAHQAASPADGHTMTV